MENKSVSTFTRVALAKVLQPFRSSPSYRTEDCESLSVQNGTVRRKTADSMPTMSLRYYDVLKRIDSGCFGDVYAAKSKITSALVAVKVVPKRVKSNSYVLNEQKALFYASGSPFLLEMEASFHDKSNFYIITEYIAGGNLEQELWRTEHHGKKLDLLLVKLYAAEMIMGVHHLHINGIIHRDLKPDNILVRPNGHLVIADFGLAAVFDEDCRPLPTTDVQSTNGISVVDTFQYRHSQWADRTVNKLCGTPQYLAPEVWERQGYGFSADWWSIGVILYRMMTNTLPFNNKDTPSVRRDVLHLPTPYDPAWEVDSDMMLFIARLLCKNPENRLKPQYIFHNYTFRDIDWTKVLKQEYTMPPITSAPPVYQNNALETTRRQVYRRIAAGGRYGSKRNPFPTFNYTSPHLSQIVATAPFGSHLRTAVLRETLDKSLYYLKRNLFSLQRIKE